MVECGGGLFGETLGGSGPAFDLVVVLGLVEEGTAAGVDVFDSEGAGHGGERLGIGEPAVESLGEEAEEEEGEEDDEADEPQ